MIATTMATTTSPRIKVPNWAPLMGSSRLSPDLLELTCGVDERLLGRQALHARGSVEAIALRALGQDELRILRRGDRPAMAQHDDVLFDLARRCRPGVDQRRAVGELHAGLGADAAARRQAHVGDDEVGPALAHADGPA